MPTKPKVLLTVYVPVDLWEKINKKTKEWAIERDEDPARSRTKWLVEVLEKEVAL